MDNLEHEARNSKEFQLYFIYKSDPKKPPNDFPLHLELLQFEGINFLVDIVLHLPPKAQ